MLKRSEWSREFLEKAMDSAEILSHKTALLPLRYENRAFFYLLDAWPTCGLIRRFDSVFAPVHPLSHRLKKGVTTVDRCLINRRPKRMTDAHHFFLNTGAGFDDTSDAFIAHAAGGNVVDKVKTMHSMLDVAFQSTTSSRISLLSS